MTEGAFDLRRASAVIFGFEERTSLSRLLPRILSEPFGKIFLAYGGTDGSREMVESIRDPRIVARFEPERIGKAAAFNRIRPELDGEVIFLLSGDIQVPAGTFEKILALFRPGVGVVIPRILPRNRRNLITRLGHALWDLHDTQLGYLDEVGENVHGGEFLAIRKEATGPIPPVINDDAYLCLRAHHLGYSIRYAREVVVGNTVPESLRELLDQRRRVNYGHTQLLALGLDPKVLDSLATRAPALFIRILLRFLATHPEHAPYLPLLALLEATAQNRGGRDFRARVDYSRWPLIRSGKSEPVPP